MLPVRINVATITDPARLNLASMWPACYPWRELDRDSLGPCYVLREQQIPHSISNANQYGRLFDAMENAQERSFVRATLRTADACDKATRQNETRAQTFSRTDRRMSVPAFVAPILLASAPVNPSGMPAAVPVILVAVAANDQQAREPTALAPPPPAAPAKSPSPTEPAAPAHSRGMDQNEIVVTSRPHTTPGDPIEKVNAQSFAATQAVDKAFVGPVALAYKRTVPRPVRSGLRNVLNNLHEPDVFLNFLLQLKPGKAVETLGRFTINSTIGGAGLFDVAKRRPFNLPRRPNGFADTLGYYGVKPGPFLFLPLIGPTTLRDVVGGGLDRLVLPLSVGKPFNQLIYTVPTGVVSALDHRAEFDEQLHKLRDGTTDPYAASRAFYLQMRQAEIDELRGKHHGAASPVSRLINPDIDPGTLPARHATAPTAASSTGVNPAASMPPDAPTLHDTSARTPSNQTPGSGARVQKAQED